MLSTKYFSSKKETASLRLWVRLCIHLRVVLCFTCGYHMSCLCSHQEYKSLPSPSFLPVSSYWFLAGRGLKPLFILLSHQRYCGCMTLNHYASKTSQRVVSGPLGMWTCHGPGRIDTKSFRPIPNTTWKVLNGSCSCRAVGVVCVGREPLPLRAWISATSQGNVLC